MAWCARTVCFATLILCTTANGQTTSAPIEKTAIDRRQEINQAVSKSIRDGDLRSALRELEASLSGDVANSVADRDPLSQGGASLHRALAQLSSQEQFDLLSRWSISTEPQAGIRLFTVLVPTVAPPSEFARALGERPRAQSFSVASIGEVRGVFSTGWALVVAARESGRLKRLITDLRPLVEKKVPNADVLMLLALMAEGAGDMSPVAEQLTARIGGIKSALPASGVGSAVLDANQLALAAAASTVPSLRPISRSMFEGLLVSAVGKMDPQGQNPSAGKDPSLGRRASDAPLVRPFLRQALTSVVLPHRTDEGGGRADDCRLKYWSPVAGQMGSRPVWQIVEDHIAHLSGAGNDALMFRYPLQGEFEFTCETQSGGPIATDGGLMYGGVQFQAISNNAEFRVSDSAGLPHGKRSCPYGGGTGHPIFNRLSIAAMPDAATMSVNLHPMWTEKSVHQTSPWLGLSSLDENRCLFRNLKLTGTPTIPRTVRMAEGGLLRGWQSSRDAWKLKDGVISLTQTPGDLGHVADDAENHLAYQRPLFSGESVSYEFFYQPGVSEVSPTLGRVALLLQPDGVRIHWVTNGSPDWTGLDADNAVTEPLNRRGPRPLPLKPNEWNRATLACAEQAVMLSLNDVVIYQQPVERSAERRFGFYRHRSAAGAQIRNVVMTGDWPETVPKEFIDNPMATTDPPLTVADRRALGEFFLEDFLAENVFAIRRRALAMPLVDRFEFLSQWILPGPDHPGIRMPGEFTPTRPSPLALGSAVKTDGSAGASPSREFLEHPELGGQVVSPVFDWLDAARELGRLTECRQRVDAIALSDDELQQRAKTSLLLMLSLEPGQPAASDGLWETFFGLLKSDAAAADGANHWPEMLLATRSFVKSPDSAVVSELIFDLATQRMLRWRQSDRTRWHNHLASLQGRLLLRRQTDAARATPESTTLHEWIPAAAGKSLTLGPGYPNLNWSRQGNKVVKVSGHDMDYLVYRLPLGGNFQIEADLVQVSQDPVAIMIAGNYFGPLGGLNGLDTGSFRTGAPPIMFEHSLTNMPKPIRFRAVVDKGVRTIYLNGRKVLETPLAQQFDPWVAIRSPGRHHGTVSDFRITGHPTVLKTVSLSASSGLPGWLDYHEQGWWEHVAKPDSSGWIVGHSHPDLAGTMAECLLRYLRPLVEDGSIEYEFFYDPGAIDVHPALDRLAFVLHPSGVREHWITDGRHGHLELSPDNLSDIPKNRRGPAELPLVAGKWNRLSLTIRGATVSIQLNDTLVYERVLEPENQRAFGLFHYTDTTESRVRNVIMRGNWPDQVPAVSVQELAGRTMDWIDADLPRLKSVFTHSFEKEGLPERYFAWWPPENPMTVTPDGVQAVMDSPKDPMTWDVITRFSLSGDFDVEASFDQAKLEAGSRYGGFLLRTTFDEPLKPTYDISRVVNELTQQLCQASKAFADPPIPGESMWRAEVSASETNSGRLRLARRGTKLYYMLAEGDSETFRLFGMEDVSLSDLLRDGVRVQSVAVGAKCKVVWKGITLRAERMTYYPVPTKSNVLVLKVIQADGTGLRTVATPSSFGFTHVGSPEWSTDGRKIAMDMSTGSTTTSRIIVMNADGSGFQDLGLGCMPSFSADGGRIAFSSPGNGIMTMKSDGTDRRVVDNSGWGTQWSPDGKWIAYGKFGNITLLNVATGQSSQLLVGENATRYSSIFWNLAWSHDSRAIAFKARRRDANQEELAVAQIDSPTGFKALQLDATATYPDVSFSPDNEQVIAAMDIGAGKGHKLHAFSRAQPGLRKLLGIIPAQLSPDGLAWSRDGKSIAFSVLDIPEPVEWVTNMKNAER